MTRPAASSPTPGLPGGQWQVRLAERAVSAQRPRDGLRRGTGVTLLFGGETARASRPVSRDGVTWRQLTPPTSPPARAGTASPSTARGVFVLFGGSDGVTRLGDVWEWDGADWSPVPPAQPGGFSYQPTGRDGFVMVFDARTEHAVVVGGETALGCVDEVWSWDGTGWTRYFADAASVLPSPRVGAAAFADDATGALRLVGGGWGRARRPWEPRLPLLARVESFGSGARQQASRGSLANGSAPVLGQTLTSATTPRTRCSSRRRSCRSGIGATATLASRCCPLAAVGLGCTLYHSADYNIPSLSRLALLPVVDDVARGAEYGAAVLLPGSAPRVRWRVRLGGDEQRLGIRVGAQDGPRRAASQVYHTRRPRRRPPRGARS